MRVRFLNILDDSKLNIITRQKSSCFSVCCDLLLRKLFRFSNQHFLDSFVKVAQNENQFQISFKATKNSLRWTDTVIRLEEEIWNLQMLDLRNYSSDWQLWRKFGKAYIELGGMKGNKKWAKSEHFKDCCSSRSLENL